MVVTKEFKKNFEIVAKYYGLKGFDDTEYEEFKVIVNKMLKDNRDFTIKWIADMAVWREPFDFDVGVVPYFEPKEKKDG